LVLAAVAAALVIGFATPAFADSGAIWTTDASGNPVNANFYDYKTDVYLNGGPKSSSSPGLPAGDYYIQMTAPDGTLLGRSWNDDSSVVHTITVGSDGKFAAVHVWDELFRASAGFTTVGYDDTTNPGGEYKVWISQDIGFTGGTVKTDNFKVGNPDIWKTWQVRVPDALDNDAGLAVRAWYSVEPPGTPLRDWDWVDLIPDPTRLNYYIAVTPFSQPSNVWWYFNIDVTSGPHAGLSLATAEQGPEAIDYPGPYLNNLDLSLKHWAFTPPTDLIADGITSIKAQYRVHGETSWTDVALVSNGSGAYIADTLFVSDTHIDFRFDIVTTHFAFTSDVVSDEEISGAATVANTFAVALKTWTIQPPAVLLTLPGVTYSAYYTTDDPDGGGTVTWVEVPLSLDGSLYTAATIFPDPTTIWYKFQVIGETGGVEYYHFTSDVGGPEVITGIDTIDNSVVLPQGTKTWRLIDLRGVVGATFFGAWSIDGTTWNEVALTEDPAHVWTGANELPDGVSFYAKFIGKQGSTVFWESGVTGPETMTSAGLTNEHTFFYGMPRTIGYWMNWKNHFSVGQIADIVAAVNSDGGGFSEHVFTANPSTDADMWTLSAGATGKKGATPTDVAYYLGTAQNASSMYQMLRAQLLGVELNTACGELHVVPRNNEVVGLLAATPVYLTKLPGYTTDAAVNPWGSSSTVTVLDVIQTIENAVGTDPANPWGTWSPEKQEFAKNVCDAINNAENGTGILTP